MNTTQQAALVEKYTKKFIDEGRLIEAGWQALRIVAVAPAASEVQLREMRNAFFAGAQHLFGSLVTIMGGTEHEPTPEELRRVDLIHDELEAFVNGLQADG